MSWIDTEYKPQAPPYNPPPSPYTSPPITIVITLVLLVFFFVSSFFIYFCRCFLINLLQAWRLQRTASGHLVSLSHHAVNPGLDPIIIQSFPSFPYSSVKDLRLDNRCGLECAICLAEFEDEDILRLLRTCLHVFHLECIDLWLELHKTCPVCRRELHLPTSNQTSPTETPAPDSVSISINEDNEVGGSQERHEHGEEIEMQHNDLEKFPRSHSTGHSIVKDKIVNIEEKYTLRLPEHAKIKVGHNQTESCITFGELSRSFDIKYGHLGEVIGCSSSDATKS